jgi:hypothetical protein
VNSDMRKALVYRMLPAFEPKRSTHPNPLNKKDLTGWQKRTHREVESPSMNINFGAFSTVGGN